MNRSFSAIVVAAFAALALAATLVGVTKHGGGGQAPVPATSAPRGTEVVAVAAPVTVSSARTAARPAGATARTGKPAAHTRRPAAKAHPATSGGLASASRQPVHRFVGVAPKTVGAVSSFTKATGVRPAVVEIYTGFKGGFPQLGASRVVARGAEPLIQWNPRGVRLMSVCQGNYDRYIRRFAAGVKAFGHPILLSFGHEMNGHWSVWSPPHATPWQFVHAWRRIHGIFQRLHVRNVTWSWDPSHTGADARPWWPGRKYVDRVGIDGYFRHGQTFKHIFAWQLGNIRRLTSKPVYIAETSVAKGPGQVRQIKGLFHGLRQYHLMGFVWFDMNRLRVWRLEGRPSAVRAFRQCTTNSQRCA